MRRTASRMIAVPMEDAMLSPPAWHSVIVMELGTHLYPASFAPARAPSDAAFEAQLDALYARIVELLFFEALVSRVALPRRIMLLVLVRLIMI